MWIIMIINEKKNFCIFLIQFFFSHSFERIAVKMGTLYKTADKEKTKKKSSKVQADWGKRKTKVQPLAHISNVIYVVLHDIKYYLTWKLCELNYEH